MNKVSLKPQQIDENNWYYEERECIEIIHQVYHKGECLKTDHIKIPKRKLKASLLRMG